MKSFEPGFIENQAVSQNLLMTIRLIGEGKGREALYREQSPQVLESLRQISVIQSTESSNRIEGIEAPIARINELVAMKTTPENRSEQEIAGYRDVLNTIHNNHQDIPFNVNIILQLHRDLYRYLPGEGGNWKISPNQIVETGPDGNRVVRFTPVEPYLTPMAMEDLHIGFDRLWNSGKVEPLLLIPSYVFDFLCIHPFSDGNGRMARLISLLLLYKAGLEVGRFISLEKLVERTKESYYESLNLSSQGWHEGQHSLVPWWEYFLGVILLGAYREFESRAGVLTESRGAKTAMVHDVLASMSNEFTLKDVKDRCPGVGIDWIRQILRAERDAGRLECLGRGPGAKWKKRQYTQ